MNLFQLGIGRMNFSLFLTFFWLYGAYGQNDDGADDDVDTSIHSLAGIVQLVVLALILACLGASVRSSLKGWIESTKENADETRWISKYNEENVFAEQEPNDNEWMRHNRTRLGKMRSNRYGKISREYTIVPPLSPLNIEIKFTPSAPEYQEAIKCTTPARSSTKDRRTKRKGT
eukprot:CAMPEP_0196814846 /NCGR_PEP_ID=MMETSP1362-20130617/46114_1 /TAXON_ID=163516 /ORGANISM="Leptocylindrus danicus, Strain CCMP1856" /LENGTH=173 /DNA_ID=CAMNT_0042191605 /DNA_START=33 /DNA_END=554 /DNA_ORIENTATION=-